MKATYWIVILSAVLSLVLSGCTKKRSDRFAQGQGLNLATVNQLGEKTYVITTTDKFMDAPVTAARKRTIEGGSFEVNGTEIKDKDGNVVAKQKINHFDFVNWTSDSELLNLGQHVRIRGKQNSQYEIRYVLTGENLLKVLKVGTVDSIPYEELAYAIDLENGLKGIPLVGYEVSWVRAEKVLNGDYEETNEYREVAVNTRAEATHYKINKTKPHVFEAVTKYDVYPVKYFTEGEWYFSAFYHTNGQSSQMMPGSSCILGGWGNPTMKVKFEVVESGLVGRNQFLAKALDTGRKIDKRIVVGMDADLLQTRVAGQGSDLGIKEEEDETVSKYDREFLKVDLKTINTICSRKEGINPAGVEIVKLTMGKDYFGYTVNDNAQDILVTYSFWRKQPEKAGLEYETKIFHQNDYKHFGMFMTTAAMYLNDASRYTEEDIRKDLRIARFNPKKPIIWYLTSQSDKERVIRDSAMRAVKYWQDAFTEAGTGMTISFVDPMAKCPQERDPQKVAQCWDIGNTRDAGDIRYNTINFLKDLNGPLGYGPSNQDIYTGETISAHSQIYYGNFKNQIIGQIRRYVRTNLGKYNSSVIRVGAFSVDGMINSGHSPIVDNGSNGLGNVIQWDAPTLEELANLKSSDLDYNFSPMAISTYDPTQAKKIISSVPQKTAVKSQIPANLLQLFPALKGMEETKTHHSRGGNILGNDYSMARRIAAKCPELSRANLLKKFPAKDITSNVEYGLIIPCMKRLIENRLVGTIVHEMGHNFGLGHNFAASFDQVNHWDHAQYKRVYGFDSYKSEVPRSTSIMEYVDDTRTQEMIAPGPYDIGVLRFGYATGCSDGTNTCSRVPVKGSAATFVEAKNGQSLDDAISAGSWSQNDLQLFRYCQDDSRDFFCKTYDTGSTTTEIAQNYIDGYRTSLAFGTKRLDRAQINENQANGRVGRYSLPLRRLYDHWRIRLFEILNSKQINPAFYNSLSEQDQRILISVLTQTQDPKHLAKMSKEQFAIILSAIEGGGFSQLEQYEGEFADLLKTRRMIFDFFTEISLLPNKYCVVSATVEGKEQFDAVEFEKVRDELKFTHATVKSCNDKIVAEYFSRRQLKVKGELGLPLYNTRYSMDDRDKNWYSLPVDEVGVALDRNYAIQLIAGRMPQYRKLFDLNLYPNMLDEPDFREEYFGQLKSRILLGQKLNLSDFGGGEIMVRRFHFESEILPMLAAYYTRGLSVPGNLTETLRRLEPFQSIAARNRFWIQNSPAATEEGGVVFAVQSLRANQARQIIERHKFFNEVTNPNVLSGPINKLLVGHLFGIMKQFIPENDRAINFDQIYGLGNFLALITDGPALPGFVEANAKAFGIDLTNKEKAAQQIDQVVQPAQWFFKHAFNYDMLIYNNMLVERVNGAPVGLPDRMKQITEDTDMAKQMDDQWKMVMNRYQGKLRTVGPIIEKINKLGEEVNPIQKKIGALQGQFQQMIIMMMLKQSELDQVKNSWIKPANCVDGSTDPKCQHPQREKIAQLETGLANDKVKTTSIQTEMDTLNAQIKPKLDQLAVLNDELEKENYTDMQKMLADSYDKVIAGGKSVQQMEALRKAYQERLDFLKTYNFANVYLSNRLPIHTVGNSSVEAILQQVDDINSEAQWARSSGIREKDAQQNMLIRLLLSLSGSIY